MTLAAALAFVGIGCSDEGDNQEENGNYGGNGGYGGGPGGGGGEWNPQPLAIAVDLNDKSSLALMESESSSLWLNGEGEGKTDGLMFGRTKDGWVDAIKSAIPEGSSLSDLESMDDAVQDLPRIVTIAIGPLGYAYIVFEYAFHYRDAGGDTDDLWSASSPYTCQIFRTAKKLGELETVTIDQETNLVCVENQHHLPTWDRNQELVQFSEDGHMYFPAESDGKQIFYKYFPQDDTSTALASTGTLEEVINSNICFRDAKVTPSGSVFYTGTTSVGGECSGDSYFRYISSAGRLIQIASDWWDYKFFAKSAEVAQENLEDDEETDAETLESETIVFYGPDPDGSSHSWDSACIYEYDPSTQEAVALVKCGHNSWEYRNGSLMNDGEGPITYDDRVEMHAACTDEDSVWVGGWGVDKIDYDATNNKLYVAGKFSKSIAGTTTCNITIGESGSYCVNADAEWESDYETQATCEAAEFTWTSYAARTHYCSNYDPTVTTEEACIEAEGTWTAVSGGSHTKYNATGASCLAADNSSWEIESIWCQSSSAGDSEQVTGVAVKDLDTDDQSMTMLSLDEEDVTNFFILERSNAKEFYYTSEESGSYSLTKAVLDEETDEVTRTVILADTEVYNLNVDTLFSNRLMFDGLRFSTNQYKVGSFDPDDATAETPLADADICEEDGLSGTVSTIIVDARLKRNAEVNTGVDSSQLEFVCSSN